MSLKKQEKVYENDVPFSKFKFLFIFSFPFNNSEWSWNLGKTTQSIENGKIKTQDVHKILSRPASFGRQSFCLPLSLSFWDSKLTFSSILLFFF